MAENSLPPSEPVAAPSPAGAPETAAAPVSPAPAPAIPPAGAASRAFRQAWRQALALDRLPMPRLVLGVAAVLLLFRIWLAAVTPITGDEAYFAFWGWKPTWGFYDHPPMVGWWLAPLMAISWAEWVVRLPALLLPFVLAGLSGWLVRRSGIAFAEERGWLTALLVLLLPTSVWNVFITTDTPLVFFSLLSVAAYVVALERQGWQRWAFHALAGLMLGLAFLSKYFSVLLGVAFLVHVVVARREEGWRRFAEFALFVTVALLGPALNIWWNCANCWANIMFNLYNRHESSGWGKSWANPFLYVVTLGYVATPFLFVALWKFRDEVKQAVAQPGLARTAFWLAAVPLGLFAALALAKKIGLHWLLSFITLLCILAASVLPMTALRRLALWLGGFAAVHVVLLLGLNFVPLSAWESTSFHRGIVLTFRTQQLLERLEPYANDYVFASDGYSNAVTLGYNARRYFIVFGVASSHARHDDILTDFRELDGKNILVLRKTEPQPGEYAPYFREVQTLAFQVEGVTFYQVLGRGFDFRTYRERVLREVKNRYYRIPGFLPMTDCYFCDRYFPGEVCR